MLALLLLVVLACVVAGIVGFVVHGLFWLFVIACVVFVLSALGGAFGRGRLSGRHAGRARVR